MSEPDELKRVRKMFDRADWDHSMMAEDLFHVVDYFDKRIAELSDALRSCRTVMLIREQEVGDRYGRARSDITKIVTDVLAKGENHDRPAAVKDLRIALKPSGEG
jgi:hypothetical protein